MLPRTISSASSSSPNRASPRNRLRDLRHRLGFGGLPHRLRPELQQLGARHQRIPRHRPGERRMDPDQAHHRQKSQDTVNARELWDKIAEAAWASRPIRASSSTPRSTNGTPARPAGGSTHRTRARNTCSWTTRPATWRRSTCWRSAGPTAPSTSPASSTPCGCGRHAGNLRPDGAVPVAQDRRTVLPLPHAGPRLRQCRRLPDGLGPALRQRRRPGLLRRGQRADDRRGLRDLGRYGGRAGPLPRPCRQRGRHAPCDAQPPPRRLWRDGGVRGPLTVRPVALDREACPDTAVLDAARAAWDRALEKGEKHGLPQRPGDGDRADRHDRPGHGLRYHRDRAGLRAGQVQEARRRRLFQDHQPAGAARPADPGLQQAADRRDDPLCRRPRHPERVAGDRPRRAPRRRLHRRHAGAGRAGARPGLRHQVRLQQVDPGRGFLHRRARPRP